MRQFRLCESNATNSFDLLTQGKAKLFLARNQNILKRETYLFEERSSRDHIDECSVVANLLSCESTRLLLPGGERTWSQL